jgi:hypothetical protein
MFFVFNDTFNNISAISWRSVLVVEEADHGQAIGKRFSRWLFPLSYVTSTNVQMKARF